MYCLATAKKQYSKGGESKCRNKKLMKSSKKMERYKVKKQ